MTRHCSALAAASDFRAALKALSSCYYQYCHGYCLNLFVGVHYKCVNLPSSGETDGRAERQSPVTNDQMAP